MVNKIKGKKILVTGGAGFIGSFVIEELIKFDPSTIYIIDNLIRGSMRNMENFIKNRIVHFIEGDIRDRALLEKYVSKVEFVFHMAALRINACALSPKEGFDVMLTATYSLAELCVKYKVEKIIISSSASVYGLAQHFPTPETDNPYNNQTFYGAAKLWNEQLFRSFKFMYNLDYIALRYFNVYGPRMDTDGKYTEVMIKWLDCIKKNANPIIYGDGTTSMDFIYVKDVARANIAALQSNVTDEIFNIGNCEETTLSQLLNTLLKINLSDLYPECREENTPNPVSRRMADISKARVILGFNPETSLEEGLKELSNWYFSIKK
jgi:UDP-glucose 4-epimerase